MTSLDKSVFDDSKRITSQRISWVLFLESHDTQVVRYAIRNLLRLKGINLRLTKLLFVLRGRNKENRPTRSGILDEFQKIVKQIEVWFQKIPLKSELRPRLCQKSSIADCSKDFIFRVEHMKSIFAERFFKKIVKVGSLVHHYLRPEPTISSGSRILWRDDVKPIYSEPWMG